MSVDWTAQSGRALNALVCVGVFGALVKAALAVPGNGNGNGNGNGDVLELSIIIRDFLPGHPDFDVEPPEGFGQYMWNVAETASAEGRPVFIGGGYKVYEQAHDSQGRDISWTLYDPALGDTPAIPDNPDTGSISSAETFGEWFQDIPGVNMSTVVHVSGPLREDGEYAGMYEINIPQFYPIDGMLLGNDTNHNHFFTCDFSAQFVYDMTAGYELYFKSDDDAWVFVDGRLVADLGGINGSPEQWIEMDRLDLEHGQTYDIRFFKADRSAVSSRFHLVTNIPLESGVTQTVLAMFD